MEYVLYSSAKDTVEIVETCTVLHQKQGTDGELLPSETISNVILTSLSEEYDCYHNVESAEASCPRDGPSLHANDSGAPTTSPGNVSSVDGKPNWDFAEINAADEALNFSVLKACITKPQRTCRSGDNAAPSSTMDRAVLAFAPGPAHLAGEVRFNVVLRRATLVLQVEIQYDHLAMQLCNVFPSALSRFYWRGRAVMTLSISEL